MTTIEQLENFEYSTQEIKVKNDEDIMNLILKSEDFYKYSKPLLFKEELQYIYKMYIYEKKIEMRGKKIESILK